MGCGKNCGIYENGDKNRMLAIKSSCLLKEWLLQILRSWSFPVASDYENEALAAESPESQ
jgi:hypothetical protein